MDNEKYCTGDIGYCNFIHSMRGIQISWNSGIVESMDCDYKNCGYTNHCKLYKQNPIGFKPTYPQSTK